MVEAEMALDARDETEDVPIGNIILPVQGAMVSACLVYKIGKLNPLNHRHFLKKLLYCQLVILSILCFRLCTTKEVKHW